MHLVKIAGLLVPPPRRHVDLLVVLMERFAEMTNLPIHFRVRLRTILEDHVFRELDCAMQLRGTSEVDVPGSMFCWAITLHLCGTSELVSREPETEPLALKPVFPCQNAFCATVSNLSPAIGKHELVNNDSCCNNSGEQGWMLRFPSELILAPILQSQAATRVTAQDELVVYTNLMRQN